MQSVALRRQRRDPQPAVGGIQSHRNQALDLHSLEAATDRGLVHADDLRHLLRRD